MSTFNELPFSGEAVLRFNVVSQVAAIFAFLLFLHFLKVKLLYQKPQKRSKRITELPGLPIVGALPTMYLHKKDIPGLVNKWVKTFTNCWKTRILGKIVYCINDPVLLKTLLDSKEPGHLKKCWFIQELLFLGFSTNGLSSAPVETWSVHRKSLAPVFAYTNIKQHLQTFSKHAKQLCVELEKSCTNYNDLVYRYMLEIHAEFTTGLPMNHYLGNAGCIQFHKAVGAAKQVINRRTVSEPWLTSPFIWRFHPHRRVEQENYKAISQALHKVKQLHKPRANSTFALDIMINEGWSDKVINDQLGAIIVAGLEATSNTVNAFLWMMAIEQEHQIACQKEIDEVFGRDSNSIDEITMEHVNNLKYLERCIKETLRLFPGTTMGTMRDMKTEIKVSDDLTIQPGDYWLYMPYAMHRNPEYFPNPEKFDPDRFLLENVKKRPAYAYLPFSAGPRNCIGWKLSYVVISVVCATILQKFHLSTSDTREDIGFQFGIAVCPKRVPKIVFQQRL